MADWKPLAIQRLKAYETRKISLEQIKEQLNALDMQFTAIRAAKTDGEPISGTMSNRREEIMIDNIQKRDELKANYKIAKREIEVTEKGLEALTKEERRILELFYILRPYDHVGQLCEELNLEKTVVYNRKDKALRKFTMACYGVVDF